MSSTHQPSRSGGLDAYYTPDADARACVLAITEHVVDKAVLEPHVGGGTFARALSDAGAKVTTMDRNPKAPGLARYGIVGDFLDAAVLGERRYHWVVGNPPFNEAEAHVRRAIAVSTIGVAFLLRLAFLESAERRSFWRDHPADQILILRSRPAFLELYEDGQIGPLRKRDRERQLVLTKRGVPKKAGVDSAAYAFFVWRHHHAGMRVDFIDTPRPRRSR